MTSSMRAPDLLKRAADIMEERGKQYDKPGGERSMAQCIAAFNAITGRDLTEQEGWTMMAVLKMVRFFQNTAVPHRDSLEDLIAYTALLGESALDKPIVFGFDAGRGDMTAVSVVSKKREVCVKTFKDAPCVHGEKCECPPTK